MPNPKSTLQIAGHPIHPMLIPFPIAFFVGAFVCDLAFWGTGNSMWATGALWLIGAGLIMAALAAVAGLTDFLGDQRIRDLSDAWWHAGGNVVAVLVELVSWYMRYSQGTAAVLPTGLVLSLIAVGGLLFTGKLTGEFIALDQDSGKQLWQFKTGSSIVAPPITYTYKGAQYVTVLSGRGGSVSGRAVGDSVPTGGSVYTFALMRE